MTRSPDLYRPGGQSYPVRSIYDRSPPPPPSDMPPLPPGLPPPRVFGAPLRGDSWRPSGQHPPHSQSFNSIGDSWRPSNNDRYQLEQNGFSFRANGTAPRYPDERERDEAGARYKERLEERKNGRRHPDENERAEMASKYKPRRANNPRLVERAASRKNYGQRPFGYRPPTAERPLLTVDGGESSKQMLGIDQSAAQRFLPVEDLSDSGEDMDESESEAEYELTNETPAAPVPTCTEGTNVEELPERPAKRRALPDHFSEASSVPKWSNPDPYTVLPPVDEPQRKRKDVVKLIRKARIAAEMEDALQNEVSANNDFISFGFEDEQDNEDGEEQPPGVPGAATGPHQPDQQSLYHGAVKDAPQATSAITSANQMGPPTMLPARPAAGLPQKPDTVVHGDALAVNGHSSLPPIPPMPKTIQPSSGDHDLPTQGSFGNQNDALGSRKRTYDDEIKVALPRPPPRRKGKGGPSNGSLSSEWIPDRGKDPTPWLVRSTLRTESPGFRLHKEICDFYDFVKPQYFEQVIREDLLERVQKAVESEIPTCNVHCFGSFAAGLYLPNADMDLVIISDSFRDYDQKWACQSNTKMHKFGGYLGRTIAEKDSVEVITGAKVPIIKFVDKITAIKVDISFENNTGIIANGTFASWQRQFPAMPILVTVIKQFLMMRGLNDVATGGLGGFSVTCLVTSMLQNMPRVQMGEVVPEHHLGEMLIEFLDLYGNQLDIARTGISMNPPGYFDKISHLRRHNGTYRADRAERLAIIDPNRLDNDISGGSKNVPLIFDRFSKAHKEIMAALNNPTRASLLDWLLGGDYDNFVWHRNHLQNLYEQRWGPVQLSRAANPQAAAHDSFPGADCAYARLDMSSSKSTSKAIKKSQPGAKVTKKPQPNANITEKPQKSRRVPKYVPPTRQELAANLKLDYPSVSDKIPAKIRAKSKFEILKNLSAQMSRPDRQKYMNEKAAQRNAN